MATPVQSFVGGLGLALSVHSLLVLNGRTFGVSGFIHSAATGDDEGMSAVAGLLAGGMVIGLLEGSGPEAFTGGVSKAILSGMLIGIGTKLSNGCTSGHMICGLSRLSFRSLVATISFFCTAAITTHILYSDTLTYNGAFDWSIGRNGWWLILLYVAALTPPLIFHRSPTRSCETPSELFLKRNTTAFCTAFSFAVALRLSNLSNSIRVLSFLILPFHSAFDPSLAFLAVGALPLATLLYHLYRGRSSSSPGAGCSVQATAYCRLILGAALFGVGWGISGTCPGPGLVNAGRSLFVGSSAKQFVAWTASVMLGGVLANSNLRQFLV
ncbi:hypothetical protein HGRIS_012837 [Hohenbuehelia grisea]|uniref:Sulphur transport domain-containing protein n=1 Tax=Hohenbuehelia grisea TaxID=104357 RepID=A0ABR3ITM7_9AGAR